jgi:SAM-dependent methyltransferase
MITIDVEAQPKRANSAPLERLIWGRFPEGSWGLGEMMNVAERQGVPLTMFLDYAEEHLYGEQLLDVGREIHRRGHDLQLHLHQQFLAAEFYASHYLEPVRNLTDVSVDAARALVDFMCDAHERAVGEKPVAFRGGGYRYNGALLSELMAHGVKLDSSCNPARDSQPMRLGARAQFKWEKGPFEVPISMVERFRGSSAFAEHNFNSMVFLKHPPAESVQRHLEFLDQFYDDFGDDAIAVLVMHSWSLLQLDEKGVYSRPIPDGLERLELLFERLAREVEPIASSRMVELIDSGEVPAGETIPFSPGADVSRSAQKRLVASLGARCSVCGTPRKEFSDADMAGRRCRCGSLERQRVFAELCRSQGFDLSGAELLAVAPSKSELAMFELYCVANVTSVDIRPEVNADLQVDICDMQQVADDSFDVVFSSFVLSHTYDPDRALAEFARVLRPGGKLYLSDPVRTTGPTREFVEPDKISAWYGPEALEKHRVGRFRHFSKEDLTGMIGRYLDVQEFAAADPPTGTCVVWYQGTARSPQAPAAALREH